MVAKNTEEKIQSDHAPLNVSAQWIVCRHQNSVSNRAKMSESRKLVYSAVESHIIREGNNNFTAETGSEYTALGFAFDDLRAHRIPPLAHILTTPGLLTLDETMSLERILENLIKRKLIALGKSDQAIQSILSRLETPVTSSSSPSGEAKKSSESKRSGKK